MTDTHMYKERLEEQLATLKKELETLGIHNPEVTEDWFATALATPTEPDPNDVADRSEEYDERRGILAELETRYNNIVRALQKIEDGEYGTCEVCGEAIASARLDANPAARTCMTHADTQTS